MRTLLHQCLPSLITISLLAVTPLASRAALITEYFNDYGATHRAVSGLGAAGDGWAGAWQGGTTVNTHPSYQPITGSFPAFTFSNANYDDSGNLTGSNDGFLRGGGSAGSISYRTFSSGLTGTVWASVVVRPSDSQDILFWLDSGGNTATNFVALRNTRKPRMRVNGVDIATNDTTFGNNTPFLFLVKMEVNGVGNNDSLQFWVKGEGDDLSSETALGSAIYTSNSSDIFGAALDDVGFSFGGTNSRVDALRISNGVNGFQDVTIIPEPSTYGAIFGILALTAVYWSRRQRG